MPSPSTFALANCVVDLARREVRAPEGAVVLTPQEVAILGYLAERPGIVVPTDTLMVEVLGYAPTVDSAAVAVAIRRLRRKIERDPSAPTSLCTVRGVGYRLETASGAPVPEPPGDDPLFVGRDADLERLGASV